MTDKLIKKLEKEGKIKKQKAGFIQVEALLKQAIFERQTFQNKHYKK